jgi:hypothetical protein
MVVLNLKLHFTEPLVQGFMGVHDPSHLLVVKLHS